MVFTFSGFVTVLPAVMVTGGGTGGGVGSFFLDFLTSRANKSKRNGNIGFELVFESMIALEQVYQHPRKKYILHTTLAYLITYTYSARCSNFLNSISSISPNI